MTKYTTSILNKAMNIDETAIEYCLRVAGWIERNDIASDLPTIESIFELFYIISITYDVSLLDEVYELIEYECEDPKPINDFIKKYKMKEWRKPKRAKVSA